MRRKNICCCDSTIQVLVGPGEWTRRAENAKINVTDEPYFGTQIVCNYLPFSKAAKGAQGGPQQYATFERKHSPTEK